jgi:hypothetical protein
MIRLKDELDLCAALMLDEMFSVGSTKLHRIVVAPNSQAWLQSFPLRRKSCAI